MVSKETYKRFHDLGQASTIKPSTQSFYAANGSSVTVSGVTQLQGYVLVSSSMGTQPMAMSVSAVVGGIEHDILWTNQCVAKGWTFSFDDAGNRMVHKLSGQALAQVITWGGCPWIVFSPTLTELNHVSNSSGDLQPEVLAMNVSENQPPGEPSDRALGPQPFETTAQTTMSPIQVDKVSEAEVLAHRLRGHIPYAPWCTHCRKARGVTQHRRRSPEEKLQVVLTADFFFVDDLKCLAFSERSTGAIGAIYMSVDVGPDRTQFLHWLSEMGLTANDGISIQLVTDSEAAVSAFVTGATCSQNWLVEKAPPQGHEFVGAAERCVRTVKEGIATIRSELAEQGVGLKLSPQSMSDILRYICHSHNLFAHAHGSDRTPKELCSGGKLHKPMYAPFLGKVLAETPDSIRPNILLCPVLWTPSTLLPGTQLVVR